MDMTIHPQQTPTIDSHADEAVAIPVAEIAKVAPPTENLLVSTFAILFFSGVGVLVRVALDALNTYYDAPVFGVIWAQIVGCFLYGLFASNKSQLQHLSLSLYTGLSTGLCGTITTWSSFSLDYFKALVGSSEFNIALSHFTFQNLVASTSVLTITIGMAIISLRFGHSIAKELPAFRLPNALMARLHAPVTKGFNTFELFLLVLGAVSYTLSILISIFASVGGDGDINHDYSLLNWALAVTFGPLGALTRWGLGMLLNPLRPRIYIGTFAANISGALIRAISQMVLVREGICSWEISFWAGGMNDGFCGGLSTLSTLANELDSGTLLEAVLYLAMSLFWSCAVIAIVYIFARN
ncbi:hypothetical protein HDU98_010446 [Podochytrium sp. JEL0797]|nr:hypothetical protein HDU98_010446 [Podochytrium sp. JEL0797]